MCECEYVCMKEVKYARVCVGVCVSVSEWESVFTYDTGNLFEE